MGGWSPSSDIASTDVRAGPVSPSGSASNVSASSAAAGVDIGWGRLRYIANGSAMSSADGVTARRAFEIRRDLGEHIAEKRDVSRGVAKARAAGSLLERAELLDHIGRPRFADRASRATNP